MNTKVREKKQASGGRVALNRDVLMTLRRGRGLSQELVALMCAEQRLSVSIASIKRAEAGKNILYRTARNISTFFGVELTEIIAADTTPTIVPNSVADQQSSISIASNRQIIVLISNLITRDSTLSVAKQKCWASASEMAAKQFDCELIHLSDTRSVFLFGNLTLMGYEHFQATHCAKWLQDPMQTVLIDHCVIHCYVHYWQVPTTNRTPQIDAYRIAEMVNQHFAETWPSTYAEQNIIITSDSVKQGLQSQFSLRPIQANNPCPDGPQWQVVDRISAISQVKRFIGRDLQREQFKAAVESVFAYSEMQIIYIRGMAGIGKTRLMEEFADYAQGLGMGWHNSHVLDFGAMQNQMAIPQLIRSILHIGIEETPLTYTELNIRYNNIVCEEQYLLFLYRWLNWPLSGKSLSLFNAMSTETRLSGMQTVIQTLIRQATHDAPLLLCIEDMHWADKDMLDSILCFSDYLKNSQVILLLTSRKEQDPLQSKWASAWVDFPMLVMNLAPLRSTEARHFAEYFTDASATYQQQCIERAGGNPLFLEQLLRHNSVDLLNLPSNIQTLVLARLDSLSSLCQTAARAASVLGQWFTEDALNFVLEVEKFDITPLYEHYIVKKSGDRIQFVHALLQQGIYQTINKHALTDLHQRCAQWFEPFDISLQARHLNRAKLTSAAVVYLQAIENKIATHHFSEAKLLVAETLNIDYTPINKSCLWRYQGDISVAEGDTQRASEFYQSAITAALNDTDKYAPYMGLVSCLDTLERYDDALATLERAETCISSENIHRELSQIHYLRGNLFFPRGQVDNCRQEHTSALHHAQLVNDSMAEAKALGGLGDAAYAQGKMITAYHHFKKCLALCTSYDLDNVEAANRFMIGTTRIYLNETKQALQDAYDSAIIANRIGHKRAEIVSRLTAGWILLDMQELERAKQQIEAGLVLAHDIGAHRFKPFLAESQARYHFYSGDTFAAKSTIITAEEDIQQQGIEEFIGPWIIGTHALILGKDNEAHELLVRGEALLEKKCIGHNYFRFYVNAMESCLLRHDWDSLEKHMSAFSDYTREEKTPWSEYYLSRARLICIATRDKLSNQSISQITKLKMQGQAACLNHSIPLFTQLIAESHLNLN